MKKIIASLLLVCMILGCFTGCGGEDKDGKNTTASGNPSTDNSPGEFVDYVAQTKLDLNSSTAKQEVTVRSYIDGDTTHFEVPSNISSNGVLKARYVCVNTPESTGKIEEWGKKASNFTKEKLKNADSIYIESNDGNWNADSTGGRYLVWVWYQPKGESDYRCLNLELIQNGLSISCGTVADRYGDVATLAFQQAKNNKLHVFSDEDDPEFYYGDAYEIDLKGLRTNIDLYSGMKVAFEGVVTRNNNNSVYVESYDAETDMYYGMAVYYGFQNGEILNILKVGNMVRVVGSVQYYETGGTYQISDVSFREFKPEDPTNTIMLSSGHQASNRLTDPETFAKGEVEVEKMLDLSGEDVEIQTYSYAELAMNTTISMENLYVRSVYTTGNGGDSDGAMTLTCDANGTTIKVRTIVLYDENGDMITADAYLNKTINVVGLIDSFSGEYQIKIFSANDIVIQ